MVFGWNLENKMSSLRKKILRSVGKRSRHYNDVFRSLEQEGHQPLMISEEIIKLIKEGVLLCRRKDSFLLQKNRIQSEILKTVTSNALVTTKDFLIRKFKHEVDDSESVVEELFENGTLEIVGEHGACDIRKDEVKQAHRYLNKLGVSPNDSLVERLKELTKEKTIEKDILNLCSKGKIPLDRISSLLPQYLETGIHSVVRRLIMNNSLVLCADWKVYTNANI